MPTFFINPNIINKQINNGGEIKRQTFAIYLINGISLALTSKVNRILSCSSLLCSVKYNSERPQGKILLFSAERPN